MFNIHNILVKQIGMSCYLLQFSIINKAEFDRFCKPSSNMVGQKKHFDCLQNFLNLNLKFYGN